MLEKTLESSLDFNEIKSINPKGNQALNIQWKVFVEAEVPILWPSDAKGRLTGKTLMLGKIEGRRRRGQQRMRWLDGITDGLKFEQTLGDSGGQRSLVCCSPWGRRVGQDSETEQQASKAYPSLPEAFSL